MANTYKLISAVTVGGAGAASINLTSIPSTFTDLLIKASLRDNRTDSPVTDTIITFNSDSGANYSLKQLYGTGSSAGSGASSSANYIAGFYESTNQITTSTFANAEIYIPNYSSSNKKIVNIDAASENNGTTAFASFVSGFWNSTSAITSIQLAPAYSSLSYVQYSTVYLYGISNS